MKKFSLLITAIVLAISVSGCGIFISCIEGNGDVIKEEREVSRFDKIRLEGIGDIFIRQGEKEYCRVETDHNIMPSIITKVRDDELIITNEDMVCPSRLDIFITVRELDMVRIQGSGDIYGVGKIDTDKMGIYINGSGDIQFEDIELRRLQIEINGSGDILIKGRAEDTNCEINGSGDINLKDLQSRNVYGEISGSGDMMLNATELLDAEVRGSGNIIYWGNPQTVKAEINGSGDIRKGDK